MTDTSGATPTPRPWRVVSMGGRTAVASLREVHGADGAGVATYLISLDAALIVAAVNERSAMEAVERAARRFATFGLRHGAYYVPHDPDCAHSRHEHTGSRYDKKGNYLGGFVADHECPPCDCGAQELVDTLRALDELRRRKE